MKHLLATTAIIAATLATPALARDSMKLYSGKYWSTQFYPQTNADNRPMCVMSVMLGVKGSPAVGGFMVKWQPEVGLFLQAYKTTWAMSQDATVRMVVRLHDNEKPNNDYVIDAARAIAEDNTSALSSQVTMRVAEDSEADFLDSFASADLVTITFPQGNELPWHSKMEGSRDASLAFQLCAIKIGASFGGPQASQPTATQPNFAGASQPGPTK